MTYDDRNLAAHAEEPLPASAVEVTMNEEVMVFGVEKGGDKLTQTVTDHPHTAIIRTNCEVIFDDLIHDLLLNPIYLAGLGRLILKKIVLKHPPRHSSPSGSEATLTFSTAFQR